MHYQTFDTHFPTRKNRFVQKSDITELMAVVLNRAEIGIGRAEIVFFQRNGRELLVVPGDNDTDFVMPKSFMEFNGDLWGHITCYKYIPWLGLAEMLGAVLSGPIIASFGAPLLGAGCQVAGLVDGVRRASKVGSYLSTTIYTPDWNRIACIQQDMLLLFPETKLYRDINDTSDLVLPPQ